MKNLSFLLLLILIYPFQTTWAQKDETRLNFYDGEYFLSDESYEDALLSYKKVYDAGFQDNANLNYRMGICYLNLEGQKNKSIPYLEKAITNIKETYSEGNFKETSAAPDALLFLGNAYRIDGQLDKAIATYQKFLEQFPKGHEQEKIYAQQEIDACRRAGTVMKSPANFRTTNLGTAFNSNMNNFNAVMSGNDSVMAFMSQRRFYDAVYFVRKINGHWSNPVNITPQIQSDGDQYVTSLSYDGKQMFLVKISNYDSDIMVSNYDQMTWSQAVNIGKPVNSKFFESHACLSPDGSKLYFTSNRSGGFGGMDIYVSEKTHTGEWGQPVNLGKTINTVFNEDSPFITSDGKRLFFSSQGHETIGGYDIFYCDLNPDGTWSDPVPEPYPMNTTDDDVFYYPIGEGQQGYQTRIQPDGLGSGDIYEIELNPEALTAEVPEVTEETPEGKTTPEVDTMATVPETEAVKEEPATEKNAEPVMAIAAPENVPAPIEAEEPSPTYLVKPIFFAFDSYELSGNARQKLGDIKSLMEAYPEIHLDIRGHTDAIGSEDYNQALSERRARVVISYLSGLGVPSERMQFRGFSEDAPVALNRLPDGRDSKEGRQLNRRVEFRIVGTGQKNIVIEAVNVPENLKIK